MYNKKTPVLKEQRCFNLDINIFDKEIPTNMKFQELDCNLDGFIIDNVFNKKECEYMIQQTEKEGYTFWNINKPNETTFRNADTIEIQNNEIAQLIFDRIKQFLIKKNIIIKEKQYNLERYSNDLIGTWYPYNTNPSILFARYMKKGHFAPHTDGYNIIDFNHRSMYSMVIYLNTCLQGGETKFYKEKQKDTLILDKDGRYTGLKENEYTTIKPICGRALIFFHNIMHEGVGVKNHCKKYIIRSDIMYERRPAIYTNKKDIDAFHFYQQAEELSNLGKMEEAIKLYRKCIKSSENIANLYGLSS